MDKEYLIEHIKKENSNFSFNSFFKDDQDKDKRAVIIITNDQMVITNNFSIMNHTMSHDETCNLVIRTIYNIMFDTDGNMINAEELESYIDFYKKQQVISIYMYNDGNNEFKLMWAYLPPRITSSQLDFLVGLEKENGELFTNISKQIYEFNKDNLVGVSTYYESKKNKSGTSIKCVIDYIRDNNMISNNEQIFGDYNIIGNTLDNSKDISLEK